MFDDLLNKGLCSIPKRQLVKMGVDLIFDQWEEYKKIAEKNNKDKRKEYSEIAESLKEISKKLEQM